MIDQFLTAYGLKFKFHVLKYYCRRLRSAVI